MSLKRTGDSKSLRSRSISLKELAAHVRLSPATVSRVINQNGTAHRIAIGTQQRVFEAAAALNYNPNIFARGLRNKRSFTVGVIIPEISEGYSTAVLGGIEDALLQAGFFYFVVSHRHKRELLHRYPLLLLSRAVEGIIAVDSPIEDDLPVPVVAVSGHRHKSTINIELDNVLAVRYALEHLKKLGHDHIAFIKGQSFSSDTAPRWKAIRKVAAELCISVEPELTVQLDGTALGIEPGRRATLKLLKAGRPFSAIFAFNDLSAMGAITTLHEAGIKVPEEISVVGLDDILSASTNNPPLTTVRQPLHEMGRISAATLLQLIQGEAVDAPHNSIQVLPTFVERKSTSAVSASTSPPRQRDSAKV